jgi:hypothetical protein
MNDPPKFTRLAPFNLAHQPANYARVAVNCLRVSIDDCDLSVLEAQALRDWLTSVLPPHPFDFAPKDLV